MLLTINSAADFDSKILQAQDSAPYLVVFTASWCPFCKVQEPRLKALEAKQGFNLVILDVDKAEGVDDRYNVQTIPSLLTFKQGKLVHEKMIAHLQPAELEAYVQECLKA